MALEVELNLEAYPKGAPLAINNLGVIENGGSKEISEEEEWGFVVENGASVRDVLSAMDGVTVKGKGKFDAGDLPEPEAPVVEEVEE